MNRFNWKGVIIKPNRGDNSQPMEDVAPEESNEETGWNAMVIYEKTEDWSSGKQEPMANQGYRDRMMGVNGNGGNKTEEDDHIWDEEDFSNDEEYRQRKKNVLCPGIDINRERRINLCRPWRKSLIIKVLGKDVGLKFLHEKIQKLWKPTGAFELIDIPNNFWLVRFTSDSDFDFALDGEPWLVAGQYLMCQRWKPEFEPVDDNVRKQAVWVRIPGLPIEYYEKHLLWELSNEIGRTLKVDMHSINEKKMSNGLFNTERGQFAWMCVEVDLSKTLVSKVHVRWKEYPVEYEGLSLICFECGCFGHRSELCPYKLKLAASPAATTGGVSTKGRVSSGAKQFGNGDNFGPWMIAPRRKGRPRLAKDQGSGDSANKEDSQRDFGKENISMNRNSKNQGNGNEFDSLNDIMDEDQGMMEYVEDSAQKEDINGNRETSVALGGHKVIQHKGRPSSDGPVSKEPNKTQDSRGQGKKKATGGGRVRLWAQIRMWT